MWIPRFAYNKQGEILYIKQGCSVAGTYTIPEIFTYETEKRDLSLAGIWVEYNPLTNTSAVNTKISDMKGPENKYGFIANTIGINANNETSYQTVIETYINALYADLGMDDQWSPLQAQDNTNRTILKITNTNQLEPIKGKAYYDETEEKIKIEVTYNTNKITKILNRNGKILSENSRTADSGEDIIGNGLYKYIVIDDKGNIKEIATKVEGLKIYVIPDLETLKEFRDEVNAGNDFSGIKVIQTADIAMNEGKYTIDEETGEIIFDDDAEQWDTIGNYNAYAKRPQFNGTYDGTGHTIFGMYIDTDYNYQGLFGYATKSTIKNLGIKESSIKGDTYVGGIVGYGNIIENCYNSAYVVGENNYVGGIMGRTNNGLSNISNCYNAGRIIGNVGYVGGIVGYGNIVENCYNSAYVVGNGNYVGGICGEYLGNTIKNNYNTGEITGKEYTGGIIGRLNNNAKITINHNYNIGKISATGSRVGGIVGYIHQGTVQIEYCYNLGEIEGRGNVAGILGNTISDITISNCYNKGNITATSTGCGGILGYHSNTAKIENSYNTGNISGIDDIGGISGYYASSENMVKCYNSGTVSGTRYVGGMIGYNNARSTINCYNMGILSGNSYVGGIIGFNNGDSASNCYYETNTAPSGIGTGGNTGCTVDTRDNIISDIEELDEYKADEYSINTNLPILSWQTDNDKLDSINGDNAFVENTNNINNGYPILAWQVK